MALKSLASVRIDGKYLFVHTLLILFYFILFIITQIDFLVVSSKWGCSSLPRGGCRVWRWARLMWNGLMCEWKQGDVFIIAVILHPAVPFRQKRKHSEGNFEKFSTCVSRLGFQHFDLFIYVFFRLFFSLFLQRTFTKKDGNTIKGIEMSTLAFERLFWGVRRGVLGWGGKKGLLGGQWRKPLSASAPWTVPVGELTPVLSTGAQVG